MAGNTITLHDRTGLFEELVGVCAGKIKSHFINSCFVFSLAGVPPNGMFFSLFFSIFTLCWFNFSFLLLQKRNPEFRCARRARQKKTPGIDYCAIPGISYVQLWYYCDFSI
jgi:hypothetical protein